VRVPAVLERVRGLVQPGASVLDIGAGTGAFGLPLAALASWVTAVDYSPAMLHILGLKLAAAAPGTDNVRPILARWEDAVLEPHDVVLAANALYRTADLRFALCKLIGLARRRGIIVWSVGRQPLREQVLPEGYRPGPDYVHALEGLFQLDVFANVELIAHVAVMWWDGPEAEVVENDVVAGRS
jgi:2-polyprenyl-3-methyl-5-hydroxy-6-metoxy-1,4-benzoquinol methylase